MTSVPTLVPRVSLPRLPHVTPVVTSSVGRRVLRMENGKGDTGRGRRTDPQS